MPVLLQEVKTQRAAEMASAATSKAATEKALADLQAELEKQSCAWTTLESELHAAAHARDVAQRWVWVNIERYIMPIGPLSKK